MPQMKRAVPSLSLLSGGQIERLHEASLSILESIGFNAHSAGVRAMLKKAGARVAGDLRVRLPREIVERALETAPSRIDIYNDAGKLAMALEGTSCYYGTGSDLKYTLDASSGEHRESRLEDVARSARLCDKLPNIDFVMSYALPNDLPGAVLELEQLRVMLENTAKPKIMTLFSGYETALRMHEMACSGRGGEDAFRKAPNYILYGQFVSPLQHDSGAIERLLFCADRAVPIIYVPTIMMGASGPVTLAGALALANAECLAGLTMHQLRAPGAPFIYGGCVSPLDMKTTVFAYNSPEWRIADIALSQLSLHYRLPVFGTGGATDAKAIDAQAGAEWTYSLLTCALSGVNLIHDVGYLESGLAGSLEALVICDEIISMVKKLACGFAMDAGSLALDVITAVGPAGHFMQEDHTVEHFLNEIWYPRLFDRGRLELSRAQSSEGLVERAAARVRELLG